MFFEGRYKTQDYFRYLLHLFSIPSFIFSKDGGAGGGGGGCAYSCLPSKDRLNYSLSLFKGWFHLCSFSSEENASCSFTYIYIYLLKLKADKLFENSDADLSWLLF